jgi:hypothetical protein
VYGGYGWTWGDDGYVDDEGYEDAYDGGYDGGTYVDVGMDVGTTWGEGGPWGYDVADGAWTYDDDHDGYGWTYEDGHWTYGEVDAGAVPAGGAALDRASWPEPRVPESGLVLSADVVPSPGWCRLYDPTVGALGEQLDCRVAFRDVPSGAWVVYRAADEPGVLHGYLFDPRSPATPVVDLVFDAASGELVEQRPA